METEEYYGGCYPEAPEHEEEAFDQEDIDSHMEDQYMEEYFDKKYPIEGHKRKPKLFKEQDVSIYKLQKDLNLSHTTLYNYVNGKRKVGSMEVTMANKIAKYFGMKLDDLYDKMKEYEKEKEV